MLRTWAYICKLGLHSSLSIHLQYNNKGRIFSTNKKFLSFGLNSQPATPTKAEKQHYDTSHRSRVQGVRIDMCK